MEMLKTLFTEEEAEILTHFTAPYQDAETMDQVVERSGKPRGKVQAIVDRRMDVTEAGTNSNLLTISIPLKGKAKPRASRRL